MASERDVWIAYVSEGVRLTTGDGIVICTLERKNAALFLSLAKGGTKGVSRDLLADRLWSSSLDDRRASLRQALTQLRRILGTNTVLADRSSCRLRPGLMVEIIQTESMTNVEQMSPATEPTPLDGLLHFSEWLSKNEPPQLFEALRANLEFALHLPPHLMLNLLEEAEPRLGKSDPNLDWCHFWRGSAYLQRGICHAAPHLRRAANGAITSKDQLLLRESSYLLAVCEILLGEPKKGLALSERAMSTIGNRDLLRSGRFADLKSSALLHLGFNEEALKILEQRASQEIGSQIEIAKNEALRALYTATGGNLRRASRVNENPYQVSRELGAKGVEVICRLTEGYIEAIDQPEKGIERLQGLIRYSQQNGFNHLALYGQETLALAYRNGNRSEDAKVALKTSVNLRKALGFRYTRWDQVRLKGLLPQN